MVVFFHEGLYPHVFCNRVQEVDAEVADQASRRLRVIGDGHDGVEAAAPEQGVQLRRGDDVGDNARAHEESNAQRPVGQISGDGRREPSLVPYAQIRGRTQVARPRKSRVFPAISDTTDSAWLSRKAEPSTPSSWDGKEGVNGSSPLEGFTKSLQISSFWL